MCGRIGFDERGNDEVADFVAAGRDFQRWARAEWQSLPPSWNLAPTDPVLVMLAAGHEDTALRVEVARWSLVPSWSKTLTLSYPTFNARSETLLEKATWRRPLQRSRCVVLSSGWYEWTGEKAAKVPHWIHDPEQPLLAFAGLYSWWPDPAKTKNDEDRWHLTATILTSDSTPNLAGLHDRAPIPLPPELVPHWIDPATTGDQKLVDEVIAAGAAQGHRMQYYPVHPIRDSLIDGPELIEQVGQTGRL